jgi:multidrug efflux pump subunit AcrB
MTPSWSWKTSCATLQLPKARVANSHPRSPSRPWTRSAIPTILATFAVIAAVLPMAFVGGLMGPYMRPIPIGASAAMLFSLLIAFTSPLGPRCAFLRCRHFEHIPRCLTASIGSEGTSRPAFSEHPDDLLYAALPPHHGPPARINRAGAGAFLGSIVAAAAGGHGLVGIGWVKVKMLPFDNKSEFQVILNMPEGTALGTNHRRGPRNGAAIRAEPEVTDYQVYAGTASPYNFNGLVRHYFMRAARMWRTSR